MKALPTRQLYTGAAMFIAAGLAVAEVPRHHLADLKPKVDLDNIIPKVFGTWHIDDKIIPVKGNPDIEATVRKTYTQTLSRTYVDNQGRKVMLSIAYARASYDGLATHVPEVCYPSQGFRLSHLHNVRLITPFGKIPARRLVASRWARIEPITYWSVVGTHALVGGWPWRVMQVRYGLRGLIPDDMLVRVSSINSDYPSAYALQAKFVRDLLMALSTKTRSRLIGSQQGA